MKRPLKPPPTPTLDSVSSDEVLSLRAFGRRLGLGVRALCDCQRRGLQTMSIGRKKYVVGSQAVAWFAAQAEANERGGGEVAIQEGESR